MRLWHVLAFATLAGCLPPTYSEPWPEPAEPLPDVPEVVLRVPADFTFREYTTGKEYFVRRYTVAEDGAGGLDLLGGEESSIAAFSDRGDLRLEVVTVLDPETKQERLANADEREYALDVLEEDWIKRDRREMLAYHREALERERRMRSDLLDQRIHFKGLAVETLTEERFALNADLSSIRETPGYQAPAGRVEWLMLEILKRDVSIAEETAGLKLLKYQRYLRDSELRRSSSNHNIRERVPVQEIVDGGLPADDLVALVKENVYPETWNSPDAMIRYESGALEMSNLSYVIREAFEYLDDLRSEYAR